MQDCERMYENFMIRFPRIAESVTTYCLTGDFDITIRLQDGTTFLYDDIEGSIRRLPSDSGSMTKKECNREFGDRLYRMMNRKGITQLELSERTGLTQAQISNYINGKSTPSFYVVDRIAKALKCSIEYFRYV